MNNRKKTNMIIAVITVAVLAAVMIAYPKMPDIIPVHWGKEGTVDGWGSKKTIFAMWAIIAGINILMLFAEKYDPKGENYKKFGKVFNVFRLCLTLFFAVLVIVMIITAFNPDAVDMNNLMFPMLGVLLIGMGNYMPKIKFNYTFGIKVPWTLASETVWNKTHRMAGPVWVIGGIVTMLSFLLPSTVTYVVMAAVIGVIIIVPTVYSYIEFNKEKNNEK